MRFYDVTKRNSLSTYLFLLHLLSYQHDIASTHNIIRKLSRDVHFFYIDKAGIMYETHLCRLNKYIYRIVSVEIVTTFSAMLVRTAAAPYKQKPRTQRDG